MRVSITTYSRLSQELSGHLWLPSVLGSQDLQLSKKFYVENIFLCEK